MADEVSAGSPPWWCLSTLLPTCLHVYHSGGRRLGVVGPPGTRSAAFLESLVEMEELQFLPWAPSQRFQVSDTDTWIQKLGRFIWEDT